MTSFVELRATLERQRARLDEQIVAVDNVVVALAELHRVLPAAEGLLSLLASGGCGVLDEEADSPPVEAAGEAVAIARPIVPAEAPLLSSMGRAITAAPDDGNPSAEPEQLTCEECGVEFPRRSGRRARWCSQRCRQGDWSRRRAEAEDKRYAELTAEVQRQTAAERQAEERDDTAEPEPEPVSNGAGGPPSLPEPPAAGVGGSAPRGIEERRCGHCHTPFMPSNPDHVYCTGECKRLAKEERKSVRRALPWAGAGENFFGAGR
ncbi:MAG: hypothetical protein ACREJ5_29410 [Geminicoccaceae bacterium]